MDTPVGNLTIELPEGVVTEVLSINAICRLCGNQSEKLTGIYSEDGIRDELANKINSYLPIKICETDELPLQCCWNCVSALLTWHNLLIVSLETDRRLKSYQLITEKQLTTIDFKAENGSSSEDSNEKGSSQTTTSLPAFCQSPTEVSDFCKVKKLEDMGYKVEEGEEVEINQYFATNCDDETTPDDLSEGLEDYIAIPSSFALQENEQTLVDSPDNQEKVVDEAPADAKMNLVAADDDKLVDYNFMCQDCPALFLHEQDILNHVTEVHPETEATRPFGKRKHTKIDPEVVNAAKVEVEGRVYYNCKQCGKSLHSPYTYIWHMRIHTGERPYVCDLCGKQFRVSQGLVRHLRETHEGIKNFPCDICGRMFATRRNVEEHRRIHTNERPYICDLCGKAFKQKASLFVHNRSHNNLFPFKCTYCNQGFRTKPPLLIHITRHTGEKPYPCDICGRCFRIKYELKRHRLIHSDEKPFVCTLCGLTFRQKRYLRNHNKINHNRTTYPRQNNTRISLSEDESSHSAAESCRYPKVFDHSFNCTPYPLEISSKYPLKAYLQDKETINKNANTERTDQDDVALDFSTNNKYSCESCAINFPSSEELNRHRDKTHVKTAVELICTICNTSYETKVKLKMHLKKSHDVSQPKTRRRNVDIEAAYFCDVCDKGFTRKYDMQKHRKIKHVGDPLMEQSSIEQRNADISSKYRICVTEEGKPVYKCDLCDRLFRQSYNLMRHRSVHTGVKDFVCHICAKTFRVATNLSRHINEFHFGVKKYACEQCGKKFKSRTTKNEHANIHYNHRPFVCDVCGKSFKQKSSLRTHKLFHGDNFKFECNLCDRKFRRRQDLKLHGWLHTGYKPNACGICKATFRLSQDLKRHCRTHQKRRECVCEDCGSSFTHERYLEVHRKIHMYTINNKGTQV